MTTSLQVLPTSTAEYLVGFLETADYTTEEISEINTQERIQELVTDIVFTQTLGDCSFVAPRLHRSGWYRTRRDGFCWEEMTFNGITLAWTSTEMAKDFTLQLCELNAMERELTDEEVNAFKWLIAQGHLPKSYREKLDMDEHIKMLRRIRYDTQRNLAA